jgi:uncharacterized repeat protein (TIGR03837 family)
MPSKRSWDIFCTVVDNYGDIGVCWRLARQLAAEHGAQVRLWIDDLASFQRICPDVDPAREVQRVRGVEVARWHETFPADVSPADIVIEAFACDPPASYLEAMAARPAKPAWINLEYLSAESWVQGCHRLPSPHPKLPLVKHFFFPGFVPGTGGLLAERGLAEKRDLFQSSSAEKAQFWAGLGLPPAREGELQVSLFCYPHAGIAALLRAWAGGAEPVRCLVPEGTATQVLAEVFGGESPVAGAAMRSGRLEARVFRFLDQDGYDRLLWACDLNLVRGEDSFVRAQWAARPLAWQIYPQQAGAHWPKLQAFLELYCRGLTAPAAAAVKAFWLAWNKDDAAGVERAWPDFGKHRAELEAYASRWAGELAAAGNLAKNLAHFCEYLLK